MSRFDEHGPERRIAPSMSDLGTPLCSGKKCPGSRDFPADDGRAWECYQGLTSDVGDPCAIALCRQRNHERDRLARVRSRVVGMFGALKEAHARIAVLEAAAREALDEWEDGLGYKGTYLSAKHGDPERLAQLREVVGPAPASEPNDLEEALRDERPAVCRFGAPGCPGWPPGCCPACLVRYQHARSGGESDGGGLET
jgi:hypothetical protein